MSRERLVGNLAFDPLFMDQYLGVREEEDHIGVVIAFASDADYVHGAIKQDQKIRPSGTRYYLFKPQQKGDVRESWIISQCEEEILERGKDDGQ